MSALRDESALPGAIDVRPVTPVIGAEIDGVDLRRPLDPATVAKLKQALLRWKVIFFRNQAITDEQQIAFGRYFGALTPAHPLAEGIPGHPEILERRTADYKMLYGDDLSVPTATPPRDYREWHIDSTFMANPNKYSILRGVEVPRVGGDTLWSNLASAYDALSPRIKALIDDLKAVHASLAYNPDGSPKESPFVALHPLVRVHPESGEKVLFLNPDLTSHIVGLKERESQALLALLIDEMIRPKHTVRFRWTPDTIAIWDNQVTAHAGPVDYEYFDSRRVVRRIMVAGDVPEGPDGFRSQSLKGELFPVLG